MKGVGVEIPTVHIIIGPIENPKAIETTYNDIALVRFSFETSWPNHASDITQCNPKPNPAITLKSVHITPVSQNLKATPATDAMRIP